jgi:PelA/Pel-15E family pectate lyase
MKKSPEDRVANLQANMSIDRRTTLKLIGGAGFCVGTMSPVFASGRGAVLDTMRRATDFMREYCACEGGYLWRYLADFSRRWGEMEAYPSMIWIQPPGTATVGHLFIDCYQATGDEYYYEAAEEVAGALVAAQHPAGGWNYLHDFAGEASTRRWYETIGRNGWRLEEFHHYYGNATFDDGGTAEASRFFLRLYLEKRDGCWRAPLDRAIAFVLDSQYDNGGWPQRFPFVDDIPSLHGMPDYTRQLTFNDDVTGHNIEFLLLVWQSLGDERALAAVQRAMEVFLVTQQASPQAGWGAQHDVKTLRPVAARSYEPEALSTATTARNISLLLDFYEWTGERRFLARVQEAIDWLESVRLDANDIPVPGREFPTFVEIGSNKGLYNHRRGSNVVNGEYYHDYEPKDPVTHTMQWRAIDLAGIQARYLRLNSAANIRSERSTSMKLGEDIHLSDASIKPAPAGDDSIRRLAETLNPEGYWPTPLRLTSHPYRGDGPRRITPGDFSESWVGDEFDTSPFFPAQPEVGISTSQFVNNMAELARSVAARDSS